MANSLPARCAVIPASNLRSSPEPPSLEEHQTPRNPKLAVDLPELKMTYGRLVAEEQRNMNNPGPGCLSIDFKGRIVILDEEFIPGWQTILKHNLLVLFWRDYLDLPTQLRFWHLECQRVAQHMLCQPCEGCFCSEFFATKSVDDDHKDEFTTLTSVFSLPVAKGAGLTVLQ